MIRHPELIKGFSKEMLNLVQHNDHWKSNAKVKKSTLLKCHSNYP